MDESWITKLDIGQLQHLGRKEEKLFLIIFLPMIDKKKKKKSGFKMGKLTVVKQLWVTVCPSLP